MIKKAFGLVAVLALLAVSGLAQEAPKPAPPPASIPSPAWCGEGMVVRSRGA